MAQLDPVEDMAALFWWRRDTAAREPAGEPAPLDERLVSLAERAPPPPRLIDLPGNRLRAQVATRAVRRAPAPKNEIALDPHLLAALRSERRSALVALAVGLVATAAPLAAAIYAAIMLQPIALGFAIAGGVAASFALYHAARWFLLTRADALPNILA